MASRILVGAIVNSYVETTSTYLVTRYSGSGKGDDHPSKLVTDVPQHFSPPGDKVTMVLWINSHCVLDNVVLKLRQRESGEKEN